MHNANILFRRQGCTLELIFWNEVQQQNDDIASSLSILNTWPRKSRERFHQIQEKGRQENILQCLPHAKFEIHPEENRSTQMKSGARQRV